jgi:hypothetical protein
MSEWHEYLSTRGARLLEGAVEDFGDGEGERRLAAGGDVVAPLTHLGAVAVSGPDAAALLQGQQTNDVREVSEQRSQIAGICSNKGRLIATYRVVRRDDAYLLVLPRVQATPVIHRLRLFVLRSKTALRDASDEVAILGLQGAHVAAHARQALGALPDTVDAALTVDHHTLVRLPGPAPRYLALTRPDSAPALWETLTAGGQPVGRSAWELTEILSGVPTVLPATADAFVPQMVNYDAIGGLSFTKGCYTGQEVVARTQYLGRLKRRLYRAQVQSPQPPDPGQEIYSPRDALGQSVGKVVSAEPAPGGGYELLAVVQIEAAGGPLHLGRADGPTLALRDLPYAVAAP